MNIEALFLKLGIPTYTTTIYSPLPVSAATSNTFPIAKQLPTQIGRIYGMAVYCDTFTPDNKALITTANAQVLYLTLKDGATNFVEDLRLSDMQSQFLATPNARPTNYLPVNIPGGFDLSTSFYSNPTGLVTGPTNVTVALKLWYISVETYNTMTKNKIVMVNAGLPRTNNR